MSRPSGSRRRAWACHRSTDAMSSVSGRAPNFRTCARFLASSAVNWPLICARPSLIGCWKNGEETTVRRARYRTGSAARQAHQAVGDLGERLRAVAVELQVDDPTTGTALGQLCAGVGDGCALMNAGSSSTSLSPPDRRSRSTYRVVRVCRPADWRGPCNRGSAERPQEAGSFALSPRPAGSARHRVLR